MNAPRAKAIRYSSLSKSGRMFLLAIVFVLLPAYLLSVSLMFLLASLFISILAYNLLLSFFSLNRLQVRLLETPELYAQSAEKLHLHLENKSRLMPAVYMDIYLKVEGLTCEAGLVQWLTHSNETAIILGILPTHRGWSHIQACHIATGYPFGFFVRHLEVPLQRELLVYPQPLASEPGFLQAKRKDQGVVPQNSEDYQYLSTYTPGDDVRRIHWRKSTLLETPVLKRDLAQTRVLDPQLFVPDPCAHFEYAISALATHFYRAENAEGWAVVTADGVCEVETRLQMLKILATIQPISSDLASQPFSAEGYRPVYASQLLPED